MLPLAPSCIRNTLFSFLIGTLLWGKLEAQSPKKLSWNKEKIARGIQYQYLHTKSLYHSQQYISLLRIKKSRRLSIDYEPKVLKPTSQFGKEEHALAAVNAGFFDMKKGGSVTYLQVEDSLINLHTSQSQMLTQHAIGIDARGSLSVIPFAHPSEETHDDAYEDMLFTGPLLLYQGNFQALPSTPFNERRHPRTCVCTTQKGHTLLITVDGRNEAAAGMTTPELAQLAKQLKCLDAINLDGGGSTTLWIAQKGVVNHPSDNKIFDEQGERRVANVILVY